MSDQKVPVMDDVPEEELESSDAVEPEPEPTAQFGGMLDAILGSYLEYQAEDGSTLNIADILLLIRQSIDANTQALLSLAGAKK